MKEDNLQLLNNFVIFQTASGKVNVDVFFQNETLWLTQKKMAELFEVERPAITKHLKNIFDERELDEKVVSSILEHTTQHGAIEGKTQITRTKYYNLNAILAVGYRVNSHRAMEFRKWASEVLHEFVIKGFAMDDERLKQIKHFGKDYFDEMLGDPILVDNGKVSMLEAKLKAEAEYDKFRIIQDKNYISDFDRGMEKYLKKNNN